MGSKKSITSTNTTHEYFDQRQVNDAGGGVIGSGNDLSTSWSQNITDARQTSNSGNTSWTQSNTDARTTSNSGNTTWTDNSTSSVIDGGAIDGMRATALAQKELASQIASLSADTSKAATAGALKAQEGAISAVNLGQQRAFDFATEQTKAAFKSSAEAIGLANKAADGLAGAYSAAASQSNGNKTLTIAAVAAVGLVAAVALIKR
ncbi:MAG: hypothetical protein ACK4S6_16260 [Roseateles asaccharophilus]|uniref:hypothetical protein n=1 Tax=Roseateles asaccharophilus TaxID=582607 RepID=UPI00391A13E4